MSTLPPQPLPMPASQPSTLQNMVASPLPVQNLPTQTNTASQPLPSKASAKLDDPEIYLLLKKLDLLRTQQRQDSDEYKATILILKSQDISRFSEIYQAQSALANSASSASSANSANSQVGVKTTPTSIFS